MLLLTLPGPVFVYQGDEIGGATAPAASRPSTAPAATAYRHPMQWDAAPAAASPPASRGCRWSTRRSATSQTSATTPRSLLCARTAS